MFSSGSSEANEDADSGQAASVDAPNGLPTDPKHPILDLAKFQLLEDQLDNPLIARTFARDFAKLWDARYETLAAAVERMDAAAALDAILSLKTSSAMVGGVRLALLAAQMEKHIRYGDLRDAQPLLNVIAECGNATVHELKHSYVLRNG